MKERAAYAKKRAAEKAAREAEIVIARQAEISRRARHLLSGRAAAAAG